MHHAGKPLTSSFSDAFPRLHGRFLFSYCICFLPIEFFLGGEMNDQIAKYNRFSKLSCDWLGQYQNLRFSPQMKSFVLAVCFRSLSCCMMKFLLVRLDAFFCNLADKVFIDFWIHSGTTYVPSYPYLNIGYWDTCTPVLWRLLVMSLTDVFGFSVSLSQWLSSVVVVFYGQPVPWLDVGAPVVSLFFRTFLIIVLAMHNACAMALIVFPLFWT